MQERHDAVPTRDGRMETFIAHPDGQGPFPAVVMYQNIGGLSDSMRDMARRVAANGYYCAVPALYYRMGTIVIDPDKHTPEMKALRAAITAPLRGGAHTMNDTEWLLQHLDRDPQVRSGPKGVIGFCGGGRLSLLAAGLYPQVFDAVISLFPGGLFGEHPAPNTVAKDIRGELYLGFAEKDEFMSVETMNKFIKLLENECKATWRAEIHADALHGFSFAGRPVYQEKAAEASWARTFEIFERRLARPARV